MIEQSEAPVNRLERRKQRTRAALIAAAQAFIAAGKLNAPVLEITQAADVGMGSFYNHFDSKEQLFEAAVTEVLDAHGALLDESPPTIDDPAETFATQLPADRPAVPAPAAGEPDPARQRDVAAVVRHGAWRRGRCATSTRPSPQAGSRSTIPNWRSRSPAAHCWGSAICCARSPIATTQRPPTVTEDVLRLFGHDRRRGATRSASARCPTSLGSRCPTPLSVVWAVRALIQVRIFGLRAYVPVRSWLSERVRAEHPLILRGPR